MKKWYIWVIAILAAAVIALVPLWLSARGEARATSALLSGARSGALLAAIAQMEQLQTSLDKALVTSDSRQQSSLLSEIQSGAASAQAGLSAIPAADDAMASALKFVNQLGDYAASLTRAGETGDAETLGELSDTCARLSDALSLAHARVLAGGAGSDSAVNDAVKEIDYPALLYDGPFADARDTAVPRGLPNGDITPEEALVIALAFVGDRALSAVRAPDSGGAIPAYGVTVNTEEGALQLAVTRQGGQVLWMSPETVEAQAAHTEDACLRAATEFLEAHGYDSMRAIWRQAYDGLLVASFAAEQDGVLLYPDQIKVQVRMDSLSIVGIETHSYLSHHIPRAALTPQISQEEAQGAISENIDIRAAGLCVIPQNSGETLCYEFRGVRDENEYLVYIDAMTGAQVEVLKVVQTNSGALTVFSFSTSKPPETR